VHRPRATPQSIAPVRRHSPSPQCIAPAHRHSPSPPCVAPVRHHSPSPPCIAPVRHHSPSPQCVAIIHRHSPSPQSIAPVHRPRATPQSIASFLAKARPCSCEDALIVLAKTALIACSTVAPVALIRVRPIPACPSEHVALTRLSKPYRRQQKVIEPNQPSEPFTRTTSSAASLPAESPEDRDEVLAALSIALTVPSLLPKPDAGDATHNSGPAQQNVTNHPQHSGPGLPIAV
jgi:hypothetical protein